MKKVSHQGFGILGAVIMMTVLSLLSGAVIHAIASSQVAQVNHLVREQAFYNVQAGIEYALKQIDDGVDPDGMQKTFAGGTFSIAYNATTGAATVSANKSGYYASASPTYSVQLPSLSNEADCLTVNVAGAYLNGASTRLQGITLQNTCANVTNIDSMSVSWTPSGSEKTQIIRIQSSNVFSSSAGVVSGALVDVRQNNTTTWWPISANTTHNLSYIDFNTSVLLKNFTLHFVMKDGSTKDAFVQFLANNQAACLQVDTSQLSIGGTGFTDYLGVTLHNACTGLALQLSKMTLTWSPNAPERHLRQVRVSGVNLWSGSAHNGDQITLNNVSESVLSAGQTRAQTRLRFDEDMRGRNMVVTYTMNDNTSLVVNYNLYAAHMASCLVVSTSSTSLSPNQKDLLGETWSNNCTLAIVVDKVASTWSPTAPNSNLTQIRVDSATVWSGSDASGEEADIDDQVIPSGAMLDVDRYRFSPSVMTNRCFTHSMTMIDGTTTNVGSFCPH